MFTDLRNTRGLVAGRGPSPVDVIYSVVSYVT